MPNIDKVRVDNVDYDIVGGEVYVGDEQDAPETTKLLIDEDDIDFNGSEVVNSLSGNQTNKAPSVKAVNDKVEELTTYSETEQVIGKWIDGRPIYKKTFSGSWDNDEIIISNVSDFINAYGYLDPGTAVKRQIPYYESYQGKSYAARLSFNNNTIYIDSYRAGVVYSCSGKFTVEYTKTTDTGNS